MQIEKTNSNELTLDECRGIEGGIARLNTTAIHTSSSQKTGSPSILESSSLVAWCRA